MKAYRDETTGRWHSDLPDVFDLICDKLRKGEPFSFSRYGDGEFNCIYGKLGANCDGHKYFPDLGKRLRETLERKPNYIVGIQPLMLASDRWAHIEKDFPNIQWVDADSIHNASIDGRLFLLFDELRKYHVTLIGPQHLAGLAKLKFNWEHMLIPNFDCWDYYGAVRSFLDVVTLRRFHTVVLLCASMMSEVIIDDFSDSGHTFIDMGSVLDPYAGVKSRRYHHKLNTNAGLSPS